jgi:hypothetical protein
VTAPVWPGYLALTALFGLAVGSLFFAAAGAILLTRTVRRGRTARPTRTTWVVDRLSPASGQWGTWGGPYDTEDEALDDLDETTSDPLRDHIAFRVVEIITTYRLALLRRAKPRPVPALDGEA